MYGNLPLEDGADAPELSADDRRRLRRDLAGVAAHTRELLPAEYAVGSTVSDGADGPRATVAVRPPVGAVVSANYVPEEPDLRIDADEREDIATGLAASAAAQVRRAASDDRSWPAR